MIPKSFYHFNGQNKSTMLEMSWDIFSLIFVFCWFVIFDLGWRLSQFATTTSSSWGCGEFVHPRSVFSGVTSLASLHCFYFICFALLLLGGLFSQKHWYLGWDWKSMDWYAVNWEAVVKLVAHTIPGFNSSLRAERLAKSEFAEFR